MSKNTQIGELINYISVNESGNVVLSNGHLVATQNYVSTAVANLVDAAPTTLDTLNELAAALGDDPNFATTVTNSIGGKLSLTGGTLSGALNGTSASFTGAVSIGDNVGNALTYGRFSAGIPIAYLRASAGSTGGFRLTNHNGADVIVVNGANAITLDAPTTTTGAATFSSSVTATGGLISNGGSIGYGGGELGFNVTTSGAASGIYTTAAGSPILYFDHRATGNTGSWVWRSGTGGGTTALTLSNVGAATFSSSVTAGDISSNGDNIITVTNAGGGVYSTRAILRSTVGGIGAELRTVYGTNAAYIGTTSASDLYLITNDIAKITILNNGSVGIGTLSPNTKLEVKGSIRLDSRSKVDTGEIDSITFTKDRPDASTGTYEMGAIRSFTYGGYAGGLTFYSGRHTGGGSYGLIPVMTIGSTNDIGLANVGIGTTTPSYKLQVNGTNGSIAVSGSGYTTNPIPMLIGQYTSTRGYIQVPNQGSVEIWNGGTSIITEFKNNSDAIFYGKVGIGYSTPLATLSTIGGAVQFMGDYRNHQTIIKSAGTAGTFNGQLTITIPEMSGAGSDGYGAYSCEVYVSGFPHHYCHVWFSGYVNGGITVGETTILRSDGGWSVSQSSFGANNQGFQFIINYPDTFIHPAARIIFNKGGSPNAAEYPANNITAVFS